MFGFNSHSEIPYFFIISFNLKNFVPAGFSHTKTKNYREIYCETLPTGQAVPTFNRPYICRNQNRYNSDFKRQDIRLSSANLGRLNIYLAFIGGEILAEAQKRRRTFLSCISAPERGAQASVYGINQR